MVRNMIKFLDEELVTLRPTPKLEDHPLLAVRDSLFGIFAATLHIWKLFLHPQPENAPSRVDRVSLSTGFPSFLQSHQSDLRRVTQVGPSRLIYIFTSSLITNYSSNLHVHLWCSYCVLFLGVLLHPLACVTSKTRIHKHTHTWNVYFNPF
jgi:hypothetical protein